VKDKNKFRDIIILTVNDIKPRLRNMSSDPYSTCIKPSVLLEE